MPGLHVGSRQVLQLAPTVGLIGSLVGLPVGVNASVKGSLCLFGLVIN